MRLNSHCYSIHDFARMIIPTSMRLLGLDVRRALFEPSMSKKTKADTEKRQVLFSHLKDTLPHSCFVLMKKAELEKKPSQPLAKVLKLSQSAVEEIKTKTIGQSQNLE